MRDHEFFLEVSRISVKDIRHSDGFDRTDIGDLIIFSKLKLTALDDFNLDKKTSKYEVHKHIIDLFLKDKTFFARKIYGSYSIVIVNKVSNTITAVCDHMNSTQVYFRITHDSVLIASDPRKISTTIDEDVLRKFLTYMDVESDKTFFLDVRKIKRSHILHIGQKNISTNKYYSFPNDKKTRFKNDGDYAQKFKELFSSSILSQMKLCNQDISFSLSGGLDSSSILCEAFEINKNKGLAKNLHAYSALFGGLSEEDFKLADESRFIDSVLKHKNIDGNYVEVKNEGPLKRIEYFSKHTKQPLRSANYFVNTNIYKLLSQKNINYHFEGFDGDDIVSHGYERLREDALNLNFYQMFKQDKLIRQRRDLKELPYLEAFQKYFVSSIINKSIKSKIKRVLGKDEANMEWLLFLNKDMRSSSNYDDEIKKIWGENPYHFDNPRRAHLYSVSNSAKEYGIEMLNDLAAIYDVKIMMPFFDIKLMEYCLSIPSSQKLNNGYDRYVFRNAMDGIIPEEVKKRTTKADISCLIKNEFKSYNFNELFEEIFDSKSILNNIVNKEKLLNEVQIFKRNSSSKFLMNIFQVLSAGIWVKQFDKI